MHEAFHALLANKTWKLVSSSSSQKLVGCKWVFRTKRNANGSFQCRKTRLVAKGYHQHEGLDFGESFSSVVKPSTIRMVLALAVSAGWRLK